MLNMVGIALCAVVLFTGCMTAKRFFFDEQVSQEAVVSTVDEVIEISPGVFTTNAISQTNWVAVTNYVPRQVVTGAVGLVASNSGIPGGGLIGTAFATILAGIGGWISRKNRDGRTIEALVEGVEKGREVLGEELKSVQGVDPASVDAKVLKAMKTVHKYSGQVEKVRPVVEKVRKVLGK